MPVVKTVEWDWGNTLIRARMSRPKDPYHKVYLARQNAGVADTVEQFIVVEIMDDGEHRIKFHTDLNNQRDAVVARRRFVASNDVVTDPDA